MPNGQQIILKVKVGEPFIETSYYSSEFGKKFNTKLFRKLRDYFCK